MKVALIPARGGSKRVVGKNFRDFAGQPIIAYAIKAALASGVFDRVVVSTDDERIAEIAKHYGAEVPFMRPQALADDFSTIYDVVCHGVEALEAEGESVTLLCLVYATAPMIAVEDLRRSAEQMQAGLADTLLSVCRFPFPVQRALSRADDGTVAMMYPQYQNTRSQDLPEAYHDAAQFAWWTREALFQGGARSGSYVVDRWRVQDIDSEEDWQQAELIYRAWQMQRPRHDG